MTQQNDNRKNARKDIPIRVKFKSATIDEFIEQYAKDVSRGGIFIKHKSPGQFPVRTLIKFTLLLNTGEPFIQGIGRVVWIRELNQARVDKPPGMGIKFIKLDEKSRAIIDRIVAGKEGPDNISGPPGGEDVMEGEKAGEKPEEKGEKEEAAPEAEEKEAGAGEEKEEEKEEKVAAGQEEKREEEEQEEREEEKEEEEKVAAGKEEEEAEKRRAREEAEEKERKARAKAKAEAEEERERKRREERKLEDKRREEREEEKEKKAEIRKPAPPPTKEEEESKTSIWVWILIIVIIVLIGYFIVARGKKKEPAPPPPRETVEVVKKTEEPPPPVEEPPPPPPKETTTRELAGVPDGATIAWADRTATAPASLTDLVVGEKAEVKISMLGFRSRVETFDVAKGMEPLEVTLEKLPATVKVSSEPAGAMVIVDGVKAGKAPATLEKVKLGKDITIGLKLKDYEPLEVVVNKDSAWVETPDAWVLDLALTLTALPEPVAPPEPTPVPPPEKKPPVEKKPPEEKKPPVEKAPPEKAVEPPKPPEKAVEPPKPPEKAPEEPKPPEKKPDIPEDPYA